MGKTELINVSGRQRVSRELKCVSPTLACSEDTDGNSTPAVVSYDMAHANDVIRGNGQGPIQTLQHRMGTGGNNIPLVQKVGALIARDHKGLNSDCGADGKAVPCSDGIRRLTPLECERLQGLPDNWTLIDNKSCSDSARYRAIGNGMAQPCADFIMCVAVEMLKAEESISNQPQKGENHD